VYIATVGAVFNLDFSRLGSRLKTAPTFFITAIQLSVYRNALPQLDIGNLPVRLGLGVPSKADFTLNLS